MLRRRAFTLVELLVVIGIIAVLISILIPVLGSAKKQANTVKCQTQLREIFACFKMYELEHKGYWPVARINGLKTGSNTNPYSIDGVNYGAGGVGQGYYFNFLAKYATKGKMGNAIATDATAASLATRTIFYGCPAWTGYYQDGFTSVGDVNLVQPGYGMNIFPTFKSNYPATEFPPSIAGNRPKEVAVIDPVNEPTFTGNFLRATRWTNPGERMLLADSRFWLAQSSRPPGIGPWPPSVTAQPLVLNANSTLGGVTMVDIFRHGKPPPVEGNAFSIRGGKVGYNVLYADGHVASQSDGKEAYRSQRMKFPG